MVNKFRRNLLLAGVSAPFAGHIFGATGNPVPAENAIAGAADWRVAKWPTFFDWSTKTYTPGVAYPEIEGYASAHSYNIGETLKLHINCAEPTYTVKIFRLGWYNGAGSRLMHTSALQTGVKQVIPTADALGKVECNWAESFSLPIPTNWVSGIYLVKLIASNSRVESLAYFIVRDDARVADFVFQCASNTSQAYNNWGGKSLYEFNSKSSLKATAISFNRPEVDGGGCGQILHWEMSMAQFLEKEGYDVKYITNIDVHQDASKLLKAKAFFSVGHDEYWSYEQKKAVMDAQAAGIHTGFFSANTCYWQVRFTPDGQGRPNRTMTSYKEQAANDPIRNTDKKRITGQWRELPTIYAVNDPVAIPENAMIGVQYHGDPVNSALIAADVSHWMYANTGITAGTRFEGLLGYETDSLFPTNGFNPKNIKKIMESPDPYGMSHSTFFTAPSGAAVFGAGTMQWSWGLSFVPSWAPNSGLDRTSEKFRQLNRNLFARFLLPALVQPKNVTATPAGPNNIVKWDAVPGALSYDVYRSTSANAPLTTPYRAGVQGTTLADTGISKGTQYFYDVIARNGVAESAVSVEANCIAGGDSPQQPTLQAQTISFAPISARKVGDGPFIIGPSASSALPVIITSLTPQVATVNGNVVSIIGPGTAIIAADQGGNSAYSPAPRVTQTFTVNAASATTVNPPTGLTGYSCDSSCWAYASQGNQAAIRINWTQSNSPGITSNTVYRGDGTTGPLVPIAQMPAGTTYVDKAVVKGKVYHYRVSATSAGGTSVQGNDTSLAF